MSNVERLKATKDKHARSLLKINGVFGVGLRVITEEIAIYVNDKCDITSLPKEIESFKVLIVTSETFKRETSGGSSYATVTTEPDYPNELWWVNKAYRPICGGVEGHHALQEGAGTLGSFWYSKSLQKYVVISNIHVIGNSEYLSLIPTSADILQPYNGEPIGRSYRNISPVDSYGNETKATWDSYGEVSIGEITDVSQITPVIRPHGALNDKTSEGEDRYYLNHLSDRYVHDLIKPYRINGVISSTLSEGTVVKKTGRTTGTSFSAIYDSDFTYSQTMFDPDGTEIDYTILNGILYHRVEKEGWEDKADLFGNFGDSGSSIVTASLTEYNLFMNTYGLYHPAGDFSKGATGSDILVGNLYSGAPTSELIGHTVSDNASLWHPYTNWQLEPLPPTIITNSTNAIGSTSITIISPINLYPNSASGQSTTNIDIQVLDITEIEPFELQSVTPSTKDSVNFNLEHHGDWIMSFGSANGIGEALDTNLIVTHQINGKAEGISSTSSTNLIVPIEITSNSANGIGQTYGEVYGTEVILTELQPFELQAITPTTSDNVNFELQIVGDIQSAEINTTSADGLGNTSIVLNTLDILSLIANSADANSDTNINLRVTGLITITANSANAQSSGSIYIITDPTVQFEEITLTIRRSKEFEVTITRNHEMKHDITRKKDITLAI